ncbi:efflux RND transporter permease subunit [Sporomusa sp.]|uniref:efflux RND transporter permease subunit n=1 Tax=Sporomusa sp. TaxID=2078658 RepID=UPI002C23BCDB|nr:efflux RND transporter permease subunit [Sporomusa sp.]HWR42879.1 efflux RND transporter permease subunit [Sporomusa sp.]
MNAIATFIRRPVFTVMLVMLLVVFGLKAYPSLGIDLNPDVDFPIVTVSVSYSGASPEEVESLITKPIEDAVSSLSGIKNLSSVTREGVSQVVIEFEFGTNPKLAANEVREKVATVRKRLPDQIDEPVIQRFDIGAQAVVFMSLSSDTKSPGEIRKLAVDVVKDELQRIDGVADVSVYGAAGREIQIQLDHKKLEAYKITMPQVLDAVNSQNLNAPGGHVIEKGMDLTVRTLGKYKSIDDIKNIIVANQDGRLIKLNDVAEVVDGWEEVRTIARANGEPSVLVSVQKQSGTNTVDVATKVKKAINNLQTTLPSDIKVQITRDSSTYINDSVHDVMMSLVFGGLLAVVITFLFLQNIRATIIGAIAIPTSVVATFFMMKTMGFTLNNMSLMGLSLAVGILIDDAIVVIENIYRHMEQGKPALVAARDGTSEIALPVMATTLSILAVFVPVGSMTGIIGQFFKQFGLTVAFAVAFSLFVAFTLTPTLSAYWLKSGHGIGASSGPGRWLEAGLTRFEQAFQALQAWYRKTLTWALERPKKLVALAVLSLFINGLLLPFLGTEFQPTYDSGEFSVVLSAPPGTSLDKMKELTIPIEQDVLGIAELESSYITIGSGNQTNKATIGVRLKPASERKRSMNKIMDELRLKVQTVGNLKIAVQTGQGVGRGDSRPVQVALRGPDLNVLMQNAQVLVEKIKSIPGTTDVDISTEQSVPEVEVQLNPTRVSDAGLDAATVANTVQMAFMGSTTRNRYNAGDSDYNIRVQVAAEGRMSMDDVANLRIAGKTGSFVRLGEIADIKLSAGPNEINREARQRQVVVYSNAIGVSAGDVINKVTELMPSLNLPIGYSYKFVGSAQTMQDSFKEIGSALLLAIALIYMVLAAEFESFIHPLTIMLSLPFSFIGAILGLLIAGQTLNIMSLIGVIMLMGLVTKNAILLVDYTNTLREQGLGITEALIEAGSVRLRPILMTTAAMIFGMMPIALGIGAGAELRQSMGVVLVGGLITSTILTLVIVPLVYLLIDRMKTKWSGNKRKTEVSV